MYSKDFFASKATWGAIVMMFGPILSQQFGVGPAGQEAIVDTIVQIIGGVLFIIGQFTRKSEIKSIGTIKVRD